MRFMSKEDVILKTARGLFAHFGLKKVTTDEIAKEAHISKATIYKYYQNKTDILKHVVDMEAREFLTALKTAVEGETTVIGKLRAYILARLTKVRDLVKYYGVTKESWETFQPHLEILAEWFLQEEKNIVKRVLQQGIREGELELGRVDLCAHLMVVTFQSVELPWALDAHRIAASDYANMIIDMMYNGIRKR